jgi:lipid-A-disaccharide synthase
MVKPSGDPATLKRRFGVPNGHRLVAMMPGVRVQDFEMHLPLFSEAVKLIAESAPNVHAGIGVSGALAERTQRLAQGPVPLVMTPDSCDLMAAADVVLTKTGTTTIECALLGTPMVAAYRTGALNFAIARALVDIPFIAMPNLIANRRVIPEFVQKAATPEALAREAILLLTDENAARLQRESLAEVRERLGPPGAVARAADLIDEWVNEIR